MPTPLLAAELSSRSDAGVRHVGAAAAGRGGRAASSPAAETRSAVIALLFGNVDIGTSRGNHSPDMAFSVPTAVLQSGYPDKRSLGGKTWEVNMGHAEESLPGQELDKASG